MAIQPAAIGIILNDVKSHVLLIKRRDVPVWVLPGGGIEANETGQEAVCREVQEETGLMIAIERQCAAYTPVNRLAAPTAVFICRIIGGALQPSEEAADSAFFPIHELPESFFFLHREWLLEGLNSSTLIKRPLSQITYFNLFKYCLRHPIWVIRFALTRFKIGKKF